jgi:hypothetical protein
MKVTALYRMTLITPIYNVGSYNVEQVVGT